MAAPLLAAIGQAVGRLVASGTARAAARGAASPGNAKSALGYFSRYVRQQSARKLSRFGRAVNRRAPGFAQRTHFRSLNRAFGSLQRARSAKASALQIGDPLKVMRAEEREQAAKERLAKASQQLLESFVGLRRGMLGVLLAVHTLPFAIQKLGQARIESIRQTSMYAGRTANALARYDVNERLNQMSTARVTSASDVRLIEAVGRLNNALKPLTDSLSVLTTEGATLLTNVATNMVGLLEVVSPFPSLLKALAKTFEDRKKEQTDVNADFFRNAIRHTAVEAAKARGDWEKNKIPPGPIK